MGLIYRKRRRELLLQIDLHILYSFVDQSIIIYLVGIEDNNNHNNNCNNNNDDAAAATNDDDVSNILLALESFFREKERNAFCITLYRMVAYTTNL